MGKVLLGAESNTKLQVLQASTMDEPRLYNFYATHLLPAGAKIFCGERPPPPLMVGDEYYFYKEKERHRVGLYTFEYTRSRVRVDEDGVEDEEYETMAWATFADFRDEILPVAREYGPRILKCLGPIAKNDPLIKNAASRWKSVREHVTKRRIGFYWHDLTQHLMQNGGVAQERDRLAFEAD